MVSQHRVHHHLGILPRQPLHRLHGLVDLGGAGHVSGVNAVKAQAQLLPVAQGAVHLPGEVGALDGAKAAGMGGEHRPRQGTALHAHHRQHRENHRQGTPPIAGQIVYGRYLSHLHLPHLRFTHHYTLPTGEWQRAFFTNSPALAILEKSKNHRF